MSDVGIHGETELTGEDLTGLKRWKTHIYILTNIFAIDQVAFCHTGVFMVRRRHAAFSCWSLSWWRHQMETFSALLVICAGNSPVPVNSPHKGQWRGAFMFALICAWITRWVNNRETGDLRRYRTHYDVIVMICTQSPHSYASRTWKTFETS